MRNKYDPFVARVKVIVLTNLDGDEYVKKAKQLGVTGYLTKANMDINDISIKITEMLKGG